MMEREETFQGWEALGNPLPVSTYEDTHSHVVQMGLKLQKTV